MVIGENTFEVEYLSRRDKNGSIDLAFWVETIECIKLQFTPNKKGLHILDCKDYFRPGNVGCVFRKKRLVYQQLKKKTSVPMIFEAIVIATI